jgi:GTPase
VARLKRAAKKTPMVMSAVAQQGVPEVLRALMKVIEANREQPETAEVAEWNPAN